MFTCVLATKSELTRTVTTHFVVSAGTRKFTDHRSIVQSDPVGARARLELGRAFAIAGDKTKAKAAYRDFLKLWKDADPNVPIFNQAKAEFAKVQ